jgi:hypothetical protein
MDHNKQRKDKILDILGLEQVPKGKKENIIHPTDTLHSVMADIK